MGPPTPSAGEKCIEVTPIITGEDNIRVHSFPPEVQDLLPPDTGEQRLGNILQEAVQPALIILEGISKTEKRLCNILRVKCHVIAKDYIRYHTRET